MNAPHSDSVRRAGALEAQVGSLTTALQAMLLKLTMHTTTWQSLTLTLARNPMRI